MATVTCEREALGTRVPESNDYAASRGKIDRFALRRPAYW